MKLLNIRWIDPGAVGGMSGASRLMHDVWDEFVVQPELLQDEANRILRDRDIQGAAFPVLFGEDNDEYSSNQSYFVEGKSNLSTHLLRERNRLVIGIKKSNALKANGSLMCEICALDFADVYGEHGLGYIECHHLRPLGDALGSRETTLNELALVCANCHRILHRGGVLLSPEQLRSKLKKSET